MDWFSKYFKYKLGRIFQKLFSIEFNIKFGQRSKIKIFNPPGEVYTYANDYTSLTDLKIIVDTLNDGETYFDVGANYGYYSLAVSDRHPNAKVHCFEPEDEAFLRLISNKLVNQFEWTLNKVGVGSEESIMKITSNQGGYNHIAVEGEQGQPCKVISLDNYIKEREIQKVDFLKVDVEGFETQVLQGAKDSISKGIIKKIILELDGHQSRYGHDHTTFADFFKDTPYTKSDSISGNFELWVTD